MVCRAFYLASIFGICHINLGVAVSMDQHSAVLIAEASSEAGQMAAETELHSMFSGMMGDGMKKPRMSEVMHKLSRHVDLKSAVHRLQHKHLPHDVLALVSAAAEGHQQKATGQFDEESLTKAREVLNDMVESAQAELDTKIIECQTFKEANRGTYDQIEADLSRIAGEIADLERLKLEAINSIARAKQKLVEVKVDFKTAYQEYMQGKAVDEADMRIKQSDLEVFQFILQFTKCTADGEMTGAPAGFVQQGHVAHKHGHRHVKICEAHDQLVIDFSDKHLQDKYERMLTPIARKEIAKVLGQVTAVEPSGDVSLLQVADEPEATEPEPTSSTYAPVMSATIPVLEGPGKSGELKCTSTIPDCGLLHDKMSIMWGSYKDQVDELQAEMDQKDAAWAELKADFMKQMEILTNAIGTFSSQLAEATSNLNDKHEEQRAKYEEKLTVEKAFEDFMGKCKKRIEWILYQDICSIVVIRNAVLVDSTECPSADIIDCDVEDWRPQGCSVDCDDSCPHANDIFACGGWQTLLRDVIVKPNPCGLQCPELTYQKKCNQIKCPVDCVMSEWSTYSKCTKDCEGGVQTRTRTVMTNAKNGGEGCEHVSEDQACNTGSCDRNCELADWTDWSPCSMACTPDSGMSEPVSGFTKRQRDVIVPTRGFGECPNPESSMRLEFDDCNTNPCAGDEECYAFQDLVLAIDGSGSLTEDNFALLKEYVVKLVKRYKGTVGETDSLTELMKVGIVQFGNGEILDDGTISAANKISPLTSDMTALETSIDSMQYLKGFTNMAQAFALAETMYTEAGREDAQSAVLTITDGKPSFVWQTQQIVNSLEDKGIQRYFITITPEEDGTETDLMKKWASDPWETNHIHVPGFDALQATNDTYVQQAIVMFCPNSQAPERCHAQVFQHGNFMGWQADFPEGSYYMSQMIANGAPNDDMSAVKVWGTDCVLTLYQHWNFGGYSVDFPEGWYRFRAFLRQGARNDDVSSLRVWRA